jgi:hypothetical protein
MVTTPTCAEAILGSSLKTSNANLQTADEVERIAAEVGPHQHRWRWPDCCPRETTSRPFPEPSGLSVCKKTSPPTASNSPPSNYPPSTALVQRSVIATTKR